MHESADKYTYSQDSSPPAGTSTKAPIRHPDVPHGWERQREHSILQKSPWRMLLREAGGQFMVAKALSPSLLSQSSTENLSKPTGNLATALRYPNSSSLPRETHSNGISSGWNTDWMPELCYGAF